jgi:hypothetical protein
LAAEQVARETARSRHGETLIMGKSKSRPKKRVFSATQAVKANARERLGTPPPSHPLPTTREKAAARPKHKETLADLLSPEP